ncbi:MAG TPA: type II toxin-antitoxin system PemK/MazF family toxin [Pseudobdellovibrionaceae bacterium]|nr:type II toxin-antitoxin system PemK/MazF family toxin [Pseudobdellovibrionaceae bacterium]
MMNIRRGDIVLTNLDPTIGMEMKKTRPVVVVSNNVSNEVGKLFTIVPVSSQKLDRIRVFEVLLESCKGLNKDSKVVVNQIRTIDATRIIKKLGKVNPTTLAAIDKALITHLFFK